MKLSPTAQTISTLIQMLVQKSAELGAAQAMLAISRKETAQLRTQLIGLTNQPSVPPAPPPGSAER